VLHVFFSCFLCLSFSPCLAFSDVHRTDCRIRTSLWKTRNFHHHSAVQSFTYLEKTPYLLRCMLILYSLEIHKRTTWLSWVLKCTTKKLILVLELWKFIIGLYDFHECWTAQQKNSFFSGALEIYKRTTRLSRVLKCTAKNFFFSGALGQNMICLLQMASKRHFLMISLLQIAFVRDIISQWYACCKWHVCCHNQKNSEDWLLGLRREVDWLVGM
jgi:hypothetical protein